MYYLIVTGIKIIFYYKNHIFNHSTEVTLYIKCVIKQIIYKCTHFDYNDGEMKLLNVSFMCQNIISLNSV